MTARRHHARRIRDLPAGPVRPRIPPRAVVLNMGLVEIQRQAKAS